MTEEEEEKVKIELLESNGSVYGTKVIPNTQYECSVKAEPVSSETAVETVTTYDDNCEEIKSEVVKEEERFKVEDTIGYQTDNGATVQPEQCVVFKEENMQDSDNKENEMECVTVSPSEVSVI